MYCATTVWCLFFFFQAEDGIRDLTVTGVQTCALPISIRSDHKQQQSAEIRWRSFPRKETLRWTDRKSTRLNSSHSQISYAVFCLKKKMSAAHSPLPQTTMRMLFVRYVDAHEDLMHSHN